MDHRAPADDGRTPAGPGVDDTSPEVRRLQIERYRQMTPAQKLELVAGLGRLADAFALAGLRLRHPGADDAELRLRLLALKHGKELVRAAYGWSADD